jgi:hypothetical protein
MSQSGCTGKGSRLEDVTLGAFPSFDHYDFGISSIGVGTDRRGPEFHMAMHPCGDCLAEWFPLDSFVTFPREVLRAALVDEGDVVYVENGVFPMTVAERAAVTCSRCAAILFALVGLTADFFVLLTPLDTLLALSLGGLV